MIQIIVKSLNGFPSKFHSSINIQLKNATINKLHCSTVDFLFFVFDVTLLTVSHPGRGDCVDFPFCCYLYLMLTQHLQRSKAKNNIFLSTFFVFLAPFLFHSLRLPAFGLRFKCH